MELGYSCNDCDKRFASKVGVTYPENNNLKVIKCPCIECEGIFSSDDDRNSEWDGQEGF